MNRSIHGWMAFSPSIGSGQTEDPSVSICPQEKLVHRRISPFLFQQNFDYSVHFIPWLEVISLGRFPVFTIFFEGS